jgi:hypothetical protein
MARLHQWSNISNLTNIVAVTVGAAVPAGRLVVCTLAYSGTNFPGASPVTDTRGNTWVKKVEALTTAGGVVAQISSILTTPLQVGDVITMTGGSTGVRTVGIVCDYDDPVASQGATRRANNNSVGSGTVTTASAYDAVAGSALAVAADALLVGSVLMVSAGRVYTPTSSFDSAGKVITTQASGDRGGVQQYRTVTPGSYSSTGTFNSSALYGAVMVEYPLEAGGDPEPTGRLKAEVGGAWVKVPLKIDGVEVPVKYESAPGVWSPLP